MVGILPNALGLGCQKLFKRCTGINFRWNWRHLKKKRVTIKEKTLFFRVFMKNRYENTISIPIGIKNTTLSKTRNLNREWPSKHCKLMTWSLWNTQNEGIWMISCTLRNPFSQWMELVFSWKKHKKHKKHVFLSSFRHFWQKRTYR